MNTIPRQAKYQACLTRALRLDIQLSAFRRFLDSVIRGGYQSMGNPVVERRILSDFLAFTKTLHQVFEDEQLDYLTRTLAETIYAITSQCELALDEPPYGHRDIALVPISVSDKEPSYYFGLGKEFSDKFERISESLTETAALAKRDAERRKAPPPRILGGPSKISFRVPYSVSIWNYLLGWIIHWLERHHPGFLPPFVFQVWRQSLLVFLIIYGIVIVNMAFETSHNIQSGFPFTQSEIENLEALPEKLEIFRDVMKDCVEWWGHVVDVITQDEEDEEPINQ